MPEEMMNAVRYYEFGSADVLMMEQAPRPKPKAGEVLVRVQAAGVLPVDWKIRKGLFPMPVKFPSIPGTSFAGIIEESGLGVTGFQKGQAVFGRSMNGTYAEYTTVSTESIALMPQSMSFVEAATLMGGASTAWRAILDAGMKVGDRVLIHGAAGGVGLFAVQFAKWKGAYVIGTAGPANQDFIRSIGVDEAVDYSRDSFEEVVEAVDFVLDTIGGDTLERSWSVLRRGGVLISIVGRPPLEEGKELGIRVLPSGLATSQDLTDIASLIDQGLVRTFVQQVYPIREVRQAHERSENGHGRGRIVLQIGGDS